MNSLGIIFAFLALFSWGFGDFFIQRSTKKFGDTITIFYITLVGTIAFSFFVYKQLPSLLSEPRDLTILLLTSIAITLAAFLDFEALKQGKIVVVESINALELPVTLALATFIGKEYLNSPQLLLIALVAAGIFLVSNKSFEHLRELRLERGVLYAFFAALAMGVTNFLFGVGARETDFFMVNWFTDVFLLIVTIVLITAHGRWPETFKDWQKNKGLIIIVSLLDNAAWWFFALATILIPIAIATGISESYIVLAALLGVFVNHERLKRHQIAGIILALGGAIMLGFL